MKAKLFSLLLIAITGLLLGGNASADGASMSVPARQDVSAQIKQIQQQISQLTIQMQSLKAGAVAVKPIPVVLTQEKLDYIQAEITRIAKEAARIKIEVGILVTLREIKQKTDALALLTASSGLVSAPAKSSASSMPISESKKREIEDKIAIVRQQISELTQELQKKTAGSQAQPGAVNDTANCSGGNCAVPTAQGQSVAPAASSGAQASPVEQKGFWQSIGDFFKKLFTF